MARIQQSGGTVSTSHIHKDNGLRRTSQNPKPVLQNDTFSPSIMHQIDVSFLPILNQRQTRPVQRCEAQIYDRERSDRSKLITNLAKFGFIFLLFEQSDPWIMLNAFRLLKQIFVVPIIIHRKVCIQHNIYEQNNKQVYSLSKNWIATKRMGNGLWIQFQLHGSTR
jgi:hypothetical protein